MSLNQGHLLTSHFKDTRDGLELSYYGTTKDGPFKLVFKRQKLVFFILKDVKFNLSSVEYERKSGGLKNFSHNEVDTIYLNRYRDLSIARSYCEQNGIRTFEIDILPTERFLMERFINAQVEFSGEYDQHLGVDVYINPQVRSTQPQKMIFSSLSLDIETGVAGELYSIGLYYEFNGQIKQRVLMLSDSTKKIDDLLTFYKDEKEILVEFLKLTAQWDPDFIIGWHVIGFDLMFLERKFMANKIDFLLGRQNSKIKLDDRKGVGFFADTYGRVILDGPPILRAAFYKYKNFKLDTVAQAVLGVGKDISSDAGKVLEIERRFKEDKEALAKYNLLDCKLVTDIFLKLNIFDLLIQRTIISGMLFDRLPVSTAAFDHAFLPRLHRKGYIAPNRIDITRDAASTGGMVIEPIAGKHKNIAVFDFKSLYPSIIRTFKIDPYSRIMESDQMILTPKKFLFSKDEHILPSIIEKLLKQRQIAKENKDSALSQAIKILMNSFYGVMGSSRCRFYHADLPSAITTTGHWILTSAINFFENRGFQVVYGDTDSVFVNIKALTSEDCTQLSSEVDHFLSQLITSEFGTHSLLECEFEQIYDQIFFSNTRSGEGVAKKRYAAIKDGKIDFVGMEFVRSDWTELAKVFQKELYEKFFQGEPLESFIKKYIKDLESGLYDDMLVYTKRLSKPPKEYTKNIPIHVKAALKIDHKGPYRLKEVSYVITKTGPEPVNNSRRDFDYAHYSDKQLRPIADDILKAQNMSFESFILGDQLSLF